MKKTMRKLTALIMVLSMCTGIIALPTAADEESKTEEVTVTVEIKDSSGTVIGEETTTTKTTTTTGGTGTTVKEESSTTTTDTSGTVVSEGTGTTNTEIKETETPSGGTQIQTDKDWENKTTEFGGDSQAVLDDDTTQKTESDRQTTVEGSSQNVDVEEKDGNKTHHYGSETGQEKTTITETITTTTVTENDLLDSQTENPEVPVNFSEGEYGNPQTTSGDWVRDPGNDFHDEWKTVEGTEETTKHKDVQIDLPDPLDDQDVTLVMKPDGEWVKKEIAVSLQDLIPSEGTQKDGSIVTHIKDDKGVVIGYTVTKYGSETTQVDDEIIEGKTTDPNWTTVEEDAVVQPPEYPATATGDDSTTVMVEEIKDAGGNIIGYKVVTTEVDTSADNSTLAGSSSDSHNDFYNTFTIPDDAIPYGTNGYIQLPVQPVAAVDTAADGTTTEITAEEIKDTNGVTIGYKTITIIRDAEGNLVSRSSVSEYGTRTTFASTTRLDPDTKQITTVTEQIITGLQDTQTASTTTSGVREIVINRNAEQEIYNLVKTTSGYVFIYKGKMYQVKEMSGHGNIVMSTVTPDLSKTPSGDGAVSESTDLRNPHYNDYAGVGSNTISDGYNYKYVGYGLESAIEAQTGANDGTLVHQFKLVDEKGNIHYVLCADYDTTAIRGTDYNMENVVDAEYYNAPTAKKIQAIVYNGFWGTTSGVGSLSTVKAFLKANSNVSDSILNGLTEGEALTATQAALWYYAHSTGNNPMSRTDAAYMEYTGNYYGGWTLEGLSENETTRVNELYKALINQSTANADAYSTELIDKDNFAQSAKLVIKEKATDASGKVKTDADNNELYITDLTFTLDVQKSDLTGNLKIYVKDEDGNVLAERQLATTDSNLVGNLLAEDSVGSGSYTIKDIELAEGVKFSLNLEGTQNLALGAYLYSAEVYSTSQTFVGLGSGTHSVDLQVKMEFNVSEPDDPRLSHSTKRWVEGKTDLEAYTRTNNLSRSRTGTQTDTTVTVTTDLYGTRTQTDVITRVTKLERDWESYYDYTVTNLNDWEVKKADAPKTGDTTLILALVSLFSGGGLILLNRKKREED